MSRTKSSGASRRAPADPPSLPTHRAPVAEPRSGASDGDEAPAPPDGRVLPNDPLPEPATPAADNPTS